uniref:Uncharacterized protein n=1 Tax=Chromera velia CCMP2878 TaxID=1169474 RepID=A0A0G4IA82_9ALVE|mmetsp:Transcript_1717/g.3542  ORF Transcript_1717/g.3542 Transcript_1717/m.3542 type:complete len:119 (+) Transcript_1717:153-509(+)|eukprot:Cvel_12387.t1-p1 / transcript=Cvel_12387.t1 / gene=Cvel_12387 / organism=Chromera_velia_CCMP2878 / gene_product=hypothetical protein / transcript_product=hypothetical protein / location=Cvel_scaffold809:30967-32404(-) / protein_length=118 / sequence_SO=supercontig / SO=protein_coding / is_pseudo=false
MASNERSPITPVKTYHDRVLMGEWWESQAEKKDRTDRMYELEAHGCKSPKSKKDLTGKVDCNPGNWSVPMHHRDADGPWVTTTAESFRDPKTMPTPDRAPDRIYTKGGVRVFEWRQCE